ncbi:MAG TPA: AbrB/MazE/SpoVT family DNA-binding domain-containing protein [Solirubrobacteraceae bacterium]|nr:AbrB/MazE/SpoVT family DNA-binding domain-containing protein [Solirubrobacteraceae bacterium]
MQVTIDRAGRIVVPKPVRSELGLTAGTSLQIEVVEDRIELYAPRSQPNVIDGPYGPVIAPTGSPISADSARAALEAIRERR